MNLATLIFDADATQADTEDAHLAEACGLEYFRGLHSRVELEKAEAA